MNEEMVKALYEKLGLRGTVDYNKFRTDIEGNPSMQKAIYDKLGLQNKNVDYSQFEKDLGANIKTPLHDYFGHLESDNNYQAYNPDIGEQGLVGAYQIDYQINEIKIKAITGSKNRDEFYSDSYAQDKYMSYLLEQYQQHLPELQKINEERGLGLSDWELMFINHVEGLNGAKTFLKTGQSMYGNESRLNSKINEGRIYLSKSSIKTPTTYTTQQQPFNESKLTKIDNLSRFPNNLIFVLCLQLFVLLITVKAGNFLRIKSRNYFLNVLFIGIIFVISIILWGLMVFNFTDYNYWLKHLFKIIIYIALTIYLSYRFIKNNVEIQIQASKSTFNFISYLSKIGNFFTFKTNYAQSIFNEGNRRLVFTLSLVSPLLISYFIVKENDPDYFKVDLFWTSAFWVYVIFHIGICI